MSLIGKGATGVVYLLNLSGTRIAVKVAKADEDAEADHRNEQKIFSILSGSAIPHLILCIYQAPRYTFLEYAPNGSLAMLLNTYQKREWTVSRGEQVLEILGTPTTEERQRWLRQLCCAVAALSDIGLAHGDIRPGNILFDSGWNVRLSDFDRCVKLGQDLVVASEPFARLLNADEGAGAGTYGVASVATEMFAIGSVLYAILKGHEPYEMDYWGYDHGVIVIERLQRKEFPLLGGSNEERIICGCWEGTYTSVHDLLEEFVCPSENSYLLPDHRQLEQWREGCEAMVKNGDLDGLERV